MTTENDWLAEAGIDFPIRDQHTMTNAALLAGHAGRHSDAEVHRARAGYTMWPITEDTDKVGARVTA